MRRALFLPHSHHLWPMSRWTSLIGALLSQIKCREIRWIRDFFYLYYATYTLRRCIFRFFFFTLQREGTRKTLVGNRRNREVIWGKYLWRGRKFSRRQMFDEHEINCSSRPVPFCRAGLGIKCHKEEGRASPSRPRDPLVPSRGFARLTKCIWNITRMQDAPQFRTNTLLLEGEREGGGRRRVHEFTIPRSRIYFLIEASPNPG